jgi:hypothetical protein
MYSCSVMLSTVLRASKNTKDPAIKNNTMEAPCRRECGPDKVRAPFYHRSILDVMVYAHILVMSALSVWAWLKLLAARHS